LFESIKNRVYTELKSDWLVWSTAIIIFFLLWLFIYENNRTFTSPKKLEYTAAAQNYSDVTIGDMSVSKTISQSFISERNTFSRIQIPFHITSKDPQGSLDIEIKEAKDGKVVFQQTVDLSKLKDGELANFDFPVIHGAKGQKYVMAIHPNGLKKGTSFTLWKSILDQYKQGQLAIDGRKVPGDLRFAILDVKRKALISSSVYILSGAFMLLLFVFSVPALKRYKNEMHKAFLVTALPIGLLLTIMVPPFDQLDELDHFLRSFEVSEGMFINHTVKHSLGNYIPVSLLDTVHKVQFINGKGYQYGIVKEAFGNTLNPAKRIFFRNYASSYPPTIYIPQAIGLNVGRFLFHSPMIMMYLGRIFNLLAYLAIVYTALKIVPVKKNLFYTLALLPMSINQSSSLSGDSMLISSSLLFVAYILYLAYGKVEKIQLRHVLTVIGIGIFVGVSKMVYIPMVLLFLIIPLSKFTDKKDFIMKLLFVLAGFTIPYIIWNLLNISNLSIPDLRIHSGVSPKNQVKLILIQPLYYLKVLVDSITGLGESKFLGMLGRKVTIYEFLTPNFVIYTFFFLMILLGLINDESDQKWFKWRRMDKFIIVFVMLTVVLLTYTALYVGYTTVGHSIIWGVQGRYFIPVAVLMFLSISNRKIIIKHTNINFLVSTIIHCCMYVFLLFYIIQINTY
jgi:uncharacterized membrane protein